jgi:hypothetical protein
MNLYEFRLLKENEQAEAVWNLGEFLAHRKDGFDDCALYEIGDFFVEVVYSASSNRIVTLKPFKTMRMLAVYWEQVGLKEIKTLL